MVTMKSPDPSKATEEYWEWTMEDQLAMPYCNECADFFFYPRYRCPICMSSDTEYREVSGRGELATYTTIYRAPTKHYQQMVPYVNALVNLEEGIRMMSNIDVESEDELEMGMELEATFVETETEYKLPIFSPADR